MKWALFANPLPNYFTYLQSLFLLSSNLQWSGSWSHIHVDPVRQQLAGDHWRLLEITSDHQRLLEITRGYWRSLEDTWRLLEITTDYCTDYWRLLEITGDYQKWLGIAWIYTCSIVQLLLPDLLEITRNYWDYQRLLEITKDYWRLLQITRDYWRLLEITGDYQRWLGIAWKKICMQHCSLCSFQLLLPNQRMWICGKHQRMWIYLPLSSEVRSQQSNPH